MPKSKIKHQSNFPYTLTLTMAWKRLLNIVTKEKHYLIVNKPPGMVCQPNEKIIESKQQEPISSKFDPKKKLFFFDVLKREAEIFKEASAVEIEDWKPIHRIDACVTGGVLVTKTLSAAQMFSRNLKKRGGKGWPFKRRYLGILSEEIADVSKRENGIIYIMDKTEKAALTKYKRVQDNLYAFELETGRKHQIRTGCSFGLRTPLVGDFKYSTTQKYFKGLEYGHNVIALHSACVKTKIGGQEEKLHFIPVPKEVIPLWIPYVNKDGEFHKEILDKLQEDFGESNHKKISLKRLEDSL